MNKGIAVVTLLLGGATALVGSYLTFKGSLSASMIATIGAAIMAIGLAIIERKEKKRKKLP